MNAMPPEMNSTGNSNQFGMMPPPPPQAHMFGAQPQNPF